jgi:mRNA-degrading endonuclease RelE of RelBE toxin-antitoxin system
MPAGSGRAERSPVTLTRAATRDLDRIPYDTRRQVLKDISTLGGRPLDAPPRVRRLRGFGFPLYRLRSGPFRILYRFDEGTVTVMRVVDRRDLDRILKRLGFG